MSIWLFPHVDETHVPFAHTGRFIGQTTPHALQFFGSNLRFEHLPLQMTSPAPQHTPLLHGPAHAMPQPPQWLVSVFVSRHAPLQ